MSEPCNMMDSLSIQKFKQGLGVISGAGPVIGAGHSEKTTAVLYFEVKSWHIALSHSSVR